MQTIEDLARYFKRSPDQLEPAHIRRCQAYLFRDRKLSPNTLNQRTGALRFFFITGGPMRLLERLTAAQLRLRSPPSENPMAAG